MYSSSGGREGAALYKAGHYPGPPVTQPAGSWNTGLTANGWTPTPLWPGYVCAGPARPGSPVGWGRNIVTADGAVTLAPGFSVLIICAVSQTINPQRKIAVSTPNHMKRQFSQGREIPRAALSPLLQISPSSGLRGPSMGLRHPPCFL